MRTSHDPLLIDQPEDDPDNRFIYDDIVQRLRAAKPARQFVSATQSANIPILGDAEQIVVLDAGEHILRGGRDAFALRQAKYRV